MKQFDVPVNYRGKLIATLKNKRKSEDKMKKDFSPTLLDFGNLHIYLARHFGFCYGVENAIEIAFKTVEENKGKRIFLLSEMIHNPQVNADLQEKGIQFLQDTKGNQLIPFESLTNEDIVIVPAFGTTLAIEKTLRDIGIEPEKYNTTCPFVEKVWNRGEQIAKKNYTIIVHGKSSHEETRATFSHAANSAPTVVVNDMEEAIALGKYLSKQKSYTEFYQEFSNRCSEGFDAERDLQRIGVINQTTMLASDTQAIADYLKKIVMDTYQLNDENVETHFADTRDTLCYATNDNQSAVYGLLKTKAMAAFVVGGYNSSNTSHLVELCEEKLPTYFINSAENIHDNGMITHFNLHEKKEKSSTLVTNAESPISFLITSGASCPDAIVEQVIEKLLKICKATKSIENMIEELTS